MVGVFRNTELAGHPDIAEMRERYERVTMSPPAVITDALSLLGGTWLAISPWVVHFNNTEPDLRINNLIVGLTVAVIGLGLAGVPARMYRLSWALTALGIWAIVAPWVIHQGAVSTGVWISNVIAGGAITLAGLMAIGVQMAAGRSARHATTTGVSTTR